VPGMVKKGGGGGHFFGLCQRRKWTMVTKGSGVWGVEKKKNPEKEEEYVSRCFAKSIVPHGNGKRSAPEHINGKVTLKVQEWEKGKGKSRLRAIYQVKRAGKSKSSSRGPSDEQRKGAIEGISLNKKDGKIYMVQILWHPNAGGRTSQRLKADNGGQRRRGVERLALEVGRGKIQRVNLTCSTQWKFTLKSNVIIEEYEVLEFLLFIPNTLGEIALVRVPPGDGAKKGERIKKGVEKSVETGVLFILRRGH